jgi:hypothetical protein
MFPFSISFTKSLGVKCTHVDIERIMSHIQIFIEKKTGEDIEINRCSLTFKSKPFNFRWNTNIMVPIERGRFELQIGKEESSLKYTFYMYRLLVIAAILSIPFGLIESNILISLFAFLWLGGMNWLLAIIRHNIMLDDLIQEINSL